MTIPYPAIRSAISPAVTDGYGPYNSAIKLIEGLFAAGQQGFWLPFTDFASLSQDSAGTLPYTALEQPVGRVLDRSGRGNHASQVTSTARGGVSARVNLFTETEFRGAGVSTGSNFTYSGLAGYFGALRFTLNAADGYAYKSGSVAAGLICVFSVVAKMDDGSAPLTATQNASDDFMLVVNGGQAQAASTVPLGGGLYRLTTAPMLINSGTIGIVKYAANSAKPFTVTAYSLVPIAQASLPYQRVNTPTDYEAVGFPKYLRLDGTDDNYTCGGGGSTTGFYYSDVIRPTGSGSRTLFYNSVFGLKSGVSVTMSPQNKLAVYVGNGSSFQAFTSAETIVNGELAHCAVWDDVTNIYMQVKGGVVQSFVKPVMPAGPATINLYNTGAVEHFNGQATEPIYRAGPPPNAYERGVIRNYQMQKAGL